MTYADVVDRLGFEQVCLGGCGITVRSHRTGFTDPFGVTHWSERRMTRRGLRRFLLLIAERTRRADVHYLNAKTLSWFHRWDDERRASEWAARLGVRFPAEISRRERLLCLAEAAQRNIALSATHPAIYAWARRAL